MGFKTCVEVTQGLLTCMALAAGGIIGAIEYARITRPRQTFEAAHHYNFETSITAVKLKTKTLQAQEIVVLQPTVSIHGDAWHRASVNAILMEVNVGVVREGVPFEFSLYSADSARLRTALSLIEWKQTKPVFLLSPTPTQDIQNAIADDARRITRSEVVDVTKADLGELEGDRPYTNGTTLLLAIPPGEVVIDLQSTVWIDEPGEGQKHDGQSRQPMVRSRLVPLDSILPLTHESDR